MKSQLFNGENILCGWNKTPKQCWCVLHSLWNEKWWLNRKLKIEQHTQTYCFLSWGGSYLVNGQSKFIFVNYPKTHTTATSLSKQSSPSTKILYCQSSKNVMMTKLSKSYHTNEIIAILNSEVHNAVFKWPTDLQNQKGTIYRYIYIYTRNSKYFF